MPQLKLKHLFAYISESEKAIDEINNRITFAVSSETLDRQNEIVEAQAVLDAIKRPGQFSANPVALACHLHRLDNGMPPAIGSWDISSAMIANNQVQMDLIFAVDTNLGLEYWKLYSKRHMRAVSISFSVIEFLQEKDVYRITNIELYEISCVAVGANPDALSKIKELFGTREIDLKDMDKYGEVYKFLVEKFDCLEVSLDELKSLIIADQGGLAKDYLGNSFEQPHPAGEKNKAENLTKILKLLKNFKE